MFLLIVKSLLCAFVIIKILVHLTNARCKSKVCLVGKTALITGANSGLGLQLAKELASRGCTVIIADKDNAENTVANLIKETHNPNISFKMVDFASFKSVRQFAEELKKQIEKLDILVNNAGIGNMSLENTEDDIQKIMQVNYFSHFLLTHLLLVLLLKSAPSRILFTSSVAAYVTQLSEANLKSEASNSLRIWSSQSYGNSKLAGAVMSRILAKKLKTTGVTSNTYHPGVVKTNIWVTGVSKCPIQFYIWATYAFIFGKSIDEGVQTSLHLSTANEVENISGKFFWECTPLWQPKQVYDTGFCEKIWKLSEEYVGLKPREEIDIIIEQWQKKGK